ncbi:MAG: glycosyltransferase family 1 protein [Candidatus Moraniibacteriota bacterium]
MKIGIDIRLIGKKQTGSEAVFFNLTKNLAALDEKNEYLLFTDNTDQSSLIKIKQDLKIENKNNFKIISLKCRNKFIWNFWTLPNYLRKNPLDIYLTQYVTPFFVSRKIKIITIIHDVSFCVFPKLIKFSDLFFLRMLIPLAIKRADKVIGVSRFTHDEIIKYYNVNSEKVEYIYNAVADNFLLQKYSQKEFQNIREKYSLPQKFILYLGTLQPRKNIPTLIEAYAKIKEQISGVSLVLAGGRNHNYDLNIDNTIRKFSLKKTDVLLPGFVAEEDKKALMMLSDCFCFPSLYEGFGIPILEAFSCNVPCVISQIPPHLEVAKDAALFFEPKDSDELSKKLLQVFTQENLRSNILKKEEEQFLEFSWLKTAKKMLRIFEEI